MECGLVAELYSVKVLFVSSTAIRRRKNKFLAMESDTESDSETTKRNNDPFGGLRMKHSPYLDNDDMNVHGRRFQPNYEDDPEENPRIYTYKGKNKKKKIQKISEF